MKSILHVLGFHLMLIFPSFSGAANIEINEASFKRGKDNFSFNREVYYLIFFSATSPMVLGEQPMFYEIEYPGSKTYLPKKPQASSAPSKLQVDIDKIDLKSVEMAYDDLMKNGWISWNMDHLYVHLEHLLDDDEDDDEDFDDNLKLSCIVFNEGAGQRQHCNSVLYLNMPYQELPNKQYLLASIEFIEGQVKAGMPVMITGSSSSDIRSESIYLLYQAYHEERALQGMKRDSSSSSGSNSKLEAILNQFGDPLDVQAPKPDPKLYSKVPPSKSGDKWDIYHSHTVERCPATKPKSESKCTHERNAGAAATSSWRSSPSRKRKRIKKTDESQLKSVPASVRDWKKRKVPYRIIPGESLIPDLPSQVRVGNVYDVHGLAKFDSIITFNHGKNLGQPTTILNISKTKVAAEFQISTSSKDVPCQRELLAALQFIHHQISHQKKLGSVIVYGDQDGDEGSTQLLLYYAAVQAVMDMNPQMTFVSAAKKVFAEVDKVEDGCVCHEEQTKLHLSDIALVGLEQVQWKNMFYSCPHRNNQCLNCMERWKKVNGESHQKVPIVACPKCRKEVKLPICPDRALKYHQSPVFE